MPRGPTPLIPPTILTRVALHVAALHTWNAAILHARGMEVVAGQPGRYEWELRYGEAGEWLRHAVGMAGLRLDAIEGLACTTGVSPAALYAACGGRPGLLAEGEAVRQWGRGGVVSDH